MTMIQKNLISIHFFSKIAMEMGDDLREVRAEPENVMPNHESSLMLNITASTKIPNVDSAENQTGLI